MFIRYILTSKFEIKKLLKLAEMLIDDNMILTNKIENLKLILIKNKIITKVLLILKGF